MPQGRMKYLCPEELRALNRLDDTIRGLVTSVVVGIRLSPAEFTPLRLGAVPSMMKKAILVFSSSIP